MIQKKYKSQSITTHVLKDQFNEMVRDAFGFGDEQTLHNFKLQILLRVVSRINYVDPKFYLSLLDLSCLDESKSNTADNCAEILFDKMNSVDIHNSYILAVLVQKDEHISTQRAKGAYYTDYRLADYLAKNIQSTAKVVLDPACGTGILLVSYVLSNAKPEEIDSYLSQKVLGADRSIEAVTGAILTLSSLTCEKSVILKLRNRILQCDSLTQLEQLLSEKQIYVDAVIGNPPWEKLKISKHEERLKLDDNIVYGSNNQNDISSLEINAKKAELKSYLYALDSKYSVQGNGEKNLYALFLELSIRLLSKGGQISMLVPAGLIRSKGTEHLRSRIFSLFNNIQITLFDNKAKYFKIDSRFKFVHIFLGNSEKINENRIQVNYAKNDSRKVLVGNSVYWNVEELRNIRPDLTIPEVRTSAGKNLFILLYKHGVIMDSRKSVWKLHIKREVDMTQNKKLFIRKPKEGYIPLLEGRMIWQYNSVSKKYISGAGRSAVWQPQYFKEHSNIVTQWFYPIPIYHDDSSAKKIQRHLKFRVGFCDIAGQTNERSMMAAVIPMNTVCGNKVPTVSFPRDDNYNTEAYCWLAIVNSLIFDWMLRQVITTTVNLFLLKSLPLPNIDFKSEAAKNLRAYAYKLSNGMYESLWERAEMLANIEKIVFNMYEIDYHFINHVLIGFPLLDKNQPAINGELKSTVTSDLLKSILIEDKHGDNRLKTARNIGAVPFVHSSFVKELECVTK